MTAPTPEKSLATASQERDALTEEELSGWRLTLATSSVDEEAALAAEALPLFDATIRARDAIIERQAAELAEQVRTLAEKEREIERLKEERAKLELIAGEKVDMGSLWPAHELAREETEQENIELRATIAELRAELSKLHGEAGDAWTALAQFTGKAIRDTLTARDAEIERLKAEVELGMLNSMSRRVSIQVGAKAKEQAATIAELRAEVERLQARRMPVLGGPSIPWELIAPHDAQARKNHGGQDLEKLASRGGLGPCEAVAILEDRPWRKMPDGRERLQAILDADLRAENTRLAARVERLEEAVGVAQPLLNALGAATTIPESAWILARDKARAALRQEDDGGGE